jgi:hypothetical protein
VSDPGSGPAGWRGKARWNRVGRAGKARAERAETVAGKIFEPRPVSPASFRSCSRFPICYIGRRVLACFVSRRVLRFESKICL